MRARLKNYLNQVYVQSLDMPLFIALTLLMSLGWVMVISASTGFAQTLSDSDIYGIAKMQILYFGLSVLVLLVAMLIDTKVLYAAAPMLLIAAYVLLIIVFIPHVGKNFNNSLRWIMLGGFTIQVSEVARLCMLIYLASYMTRRGDKVRSSLQGFLLPMGLIGIAALLLLAEPDLGAAVVLATTCMGVLFLAGAKLRHFAATLLLLAALAAMLVVSASYRSRRLIFLDPWQSAIGDGYQLIQSLMAFASGGFSGVGLGASIQKLGYLPEAHNDFVFSILAEELGFIGVILVICLYFVLIWRVLAIGAKALERNMQFGAFLCFGIAIWLICQVLINMGVSTGLLPTKGLVLPFMSSGGSAVVMAGASLGMVLRINYEAEQIAAPESAKIKKTKPQDYKANEGAL